MHLRSLFVGVTIPLSNQEHAVVNKIASSNVYSSEDLNQQEQYMADELYRKGILSKTLKDAILYYYIKSDDLDKEPLL